MTQENQEISPLLEYDNSLPAMLEPSKLIAHIEDMPQAVVFCFFQRPIQEFCADANMPIIAQLGSEIGKNPVYVLEHQGTRVAVTHPGVGAPLSGSFLEELIAFGGRKFIAVGGAGVLDGKIAAGHVIVPTSAIRDEGTSYHYLPPSREVAPDPAAVQAIVDTLNAHDVPHDLGKTWTTDGVYRETPDKIRRRKAEGALTVEMEASAFFAIAQFRGVQFGQMLYGGDDVSGEEWDSRGWSNLHDVREKLFWLAVEAATRL
ncbi:MAG: nucleoside phosphorylase [Anaerolineae bacterium]|nr:nucleoside phosphorylase [Anaerolineae bacterium]